MSKQRFFLKKKCVKDMTELEFIMTNNAIKGVQR